MTVQGIPHALLISDFWLANDYFTINKSFCLIRKFNNCFVLNNEKKIKPFPSYTFLFTLFILNDGLLILSKKGR